MSSSLRNAVKRITHKERAQPRARAKLGLLEKKKDYKLRADNYHEKERTVKQLAEKAAMRNPDEFYFGMHKTQVVDGHHTKTKEATQKEFEAKVGLDTIRIMKDQDLSYIRMQKQMDMKKVEKLQASLHFLEETAAVAESKKRKHTIFVDSKKEAEDFDVATHFDTLPEFAGRSFNRPKIDQLRKSALESESNKAKPGGKSKNLLKKDSERKDVARARAAAYAELDARKKRIEKLELAESHLSLEKHVQGKGKKRKIKAAENGRPAQYQWATKRLR